MKKIGFDIDGVLTDVRKFQIEYGKKFFIEKYNMDIVDENAYSIKKMFNCTDEQEYEFWKKYIIFYSIKWPIRAGASEIINKLKEDGNEIYIISSRIKACEKSPIGTLMRFLVKRWLQNNDINIDSDKFFFCSTLDSALEKTKICEELNIDYMIEDCPDNIESIKEVTNVIAYSNSYNQNISNEITKVNGFYEIYDIISKSYEEKKFRFLKKAERDELSKTELIEYYKQLKENYINSNTITNIEKTEKFYSRVYPFLKKVFDFKYPHIVENPEMIPEDKGIIFVANHRDMIDPPLIMSVLGNRSAHLLLKSEFLESNFSSFLTNMGFVFVERGNRDSEILASEELSKLVLKGKDIIVFPEGTRNKSNKTLLDFKKGAVTIAQRTGAPIVPIAITKVFDDYSEKIVIKIGEKMYVDYFDDICQKNNELKENIENMIIDSNNVKIKKK